MAASPSDVPPSSSEPENPVLSIESLPQAIVAHILARELVTQRDLDAICAQIDQAQAAAPALPFILDLAKVMFMGSLAMGMLVGLNNEFKARRQRLIFAGLSSNVLRSLTVSRLDQIVEIVPDSAAAVRVLGK